jgi:hypothetical protein
MNYLLGLNDEKYLSVMMKNGSPNCGASVVTENFNVFICRI